MNELKSTLTKEDKVWVLRIENNEGRVQEYRCATESQARALALVLAPPKAAAV